MKNRFHFKMGVGKRVDTDFQTGLEGGAVGADMKIDILDGGRHKISIQL